MSVNLIFKIAAVGILVSVLSQVLKHSGREEQAFLSLIHIFNLPYVPAVSQKDVPFKASLGDHLVKERLLS